MEGYGEICAEKVPEQYKFEIAKAKEEKTKAVNESKETSRYAEVAWNEIRKRDCAGILP